MTKVKHLGVSPEECAKRDDVCEFVYHPKLIEQYGEEEFYKQALKMSKEFGYNDCCIVIADRLPNANN